MAGLLGAFQGKVHISFKLDGAEGRRTVTMKRGATRQAEKLPLFREGETVAGTVVITPTSARRVEHQGLKIELLGQAELLSERGAAYNFVSLSRNLSNEGILDRPAKFTFEFPSVEMPYESYSGMHVRVRYLLRVTFARQYGMSQTESLELWVRNPEALPEVNNPIKMEVGIEDCLHIEFEYSKAKYHLRDVVVGKIYFLMVRIHIKHMEIEIKRRETTGTGGSQHSESETVAKYEVMDGEPASRECIPIRLYLSNYDLTPSYGNVLNKFSVRYFLQLVLIDEEDRRYFKQQEITLFRKDDAAGDTPLASPQAASAATVASE
uniref:Vacuolar protein sorting-associated protein 26 n=1 Tax=Prasinoderma coloniale TaxID=156133 RepID=A0A7R9XVG1_9VIRI|eukprot:PRCOL_00002856-RA